MSSISAQAAEDIYSFVRDMEIQRFITPGAEVEGYVYTHQDEGIKSINVSLFGNKRLLSFHMAVDVPGLTTDFADLNLSKLYDKIGSLPFITSDMWNKIPKIYSII